jgi:hypothetical protein
MGPDLDQQWPPDCTCDGEGLTLVSRVPRVGAMPELWNPFKEALAARAIKFFVFGEINYRDAFDDLHFTRYRFELSPDAEGIKEDAFVFCPEGNESN